MILDGKIPDGALAEKWDRRRQQMKLVSPANKRKFNIIVVGTGLAGASAAATLGELGYTVDAFCYQDSPRRGHSISARAGSTRQRIIQVTVTAFFASFMIRSKEGISGRVRRTYTVWPC